MIHRHHKRRRHHQQARMQQQIHQQYFLIQNRHPIKILLRQSQRIVMKKSMRLNKKFLKRCLKPHQRPMTKKINKKHPRIAVERDHVASLILKPSKKCVSIICRIVQYTGIQRCSVKLPKLSIRPNRQLKRHRKVHSHLVPIHLMSRVLQVSLKHHHHHHYYC